MDIEYIERLDEKILGLLDKEFRIYASKRGINSNYQFFTFIAREKDEIASVLKGHSNYEEVIVEDFIVIEKYRGKGIGTKVLKKVEEYHKMKGFKCMSLCTYAFQAPEFYKKCGFTLEFIRESKENPRLTKYFFVKCF